MTSKLKVNLINDAGDNNLITSDGSGSVTLGAAFPSVGKIGQQVVGTTSTAITDNSGAYIDTGLTLNITPSAATSKINLIAAMPIRMDDSGGTDNGMKIRFMRDSTAIWEGDGNQLYLYTNSSVAEINFQWTQYVLDTPNTTSQITYKIQSERSGDTRYIVMLNSKPGYLVAQEVLA